MQRCDGRFAEPAVGQSERLCPAFSSSFHGSGRDDGGVASHSIASVLLKVEEETKRLRKAIRHHGDIPHTSRTSRGQSAQFRTSRVQGHSTHRSRSSGLSPHPPRVCPHIHPVQTSSRERVTAGTKTIPAETAADFPYCYGKRTVPIVDHRREQSADGDDKKLRAHHTLR